MALFQNSVLIKYLNTLDKAKVEIAYNAFQKYFGDATIQENIREAKEEQFQEGFLRKLFVEILGYTINPDANYNLTTELKNEANSKKVDGAIQISGKTIAVIELKGTDTTDLAKVEVQAFGYKNNQRDCVYVVSSNFEKLRFYIDNAIDHIEFNLFKLSADEFKLLWLCLSLESITNNTPKKLKDESISKEDTITKQLYKDYSAFKNALYNNLVQLNPQFDKLLLFKKTQKLLDRFLFIFFAEDRQLLPPNSMREILKQWKTLQELDEHIPLYNRFLKYFGYMNTGHKGKQHDIYAYNGGLFLADEVLDNVKIDDGVLYTHTEKLSNYDFQSEVDVNILGHIFENSLNEIEEITSEIEGNLIDSTKSKRKKDGVFYTPKYVTKYIVDNTVGKLCEEHKQALQLIEEEYTNDKKKTKAVKQTLTEKLSTYRNWLLQLTICDPACGSGAFLNQALEYLITEHRYIDELQAKLFGDAIVLSDVENSILENNLFGVDLNDESVEIAKLSLWLRTAQPNRKLNSLNENIKCGNSLIDDQSVAEVKAFNWNNEFSKVFANGGFDVVIGNPPYVNSKENNFTNSTKNYFLENYKTALYQIDLYVLFIEKCHYLINSAGVSSLIIPNSWLNNSYLEGVRKYLIEDTEIIDLVEMPKNTFSDANVDTVILTISKSFQNRKTTLRHCSNNNFDLIDSVFQQDWKLQQGTIINLRTNNNINSIINKIRIGSVCFSELAEVGRGVGVYHKRVGHTKEFIELDPYQSDIKSDETFVPYIRGRNVNFYLNSWNNDSFISYGKWLAEPRDPKFFNGERILLRQIPSKKLLVTLINEHFIIDQSVFIGKLKEEFVDISKSVLAIIGSQLMSFYFRYNFSEFDELFPKVKLEHFKSFPIKIPSIEYQNLISPLVEKMLDLNKDFQLQSQRFQTRIKTDYHLEKLSSKLEKYYELSASAFFSELKKSKIELRPIDKDDLQEYFEVYKKKVLDLKVQIENTDKEIDQIVYKLYDLTDEEIKIIESQ